MDIYEKMKLIEKMVMTKDPVEASKMNDQIYGLSTCPESGFKYKKTSHTLENILELSLKNIEKKQLLKLRSK